VARAKVRLVRRAGLHDQSRQREITLRERRVACRYSVAAHARVSRSVAPLSRLGKIAYPRVFINFLLTTRHEIAAGIQRLRPSPVEPTPVSGSIFVGQKKVIRKADAMTFNRIDRSGFAPHRCERREGHRSTAVAQLLTSAALALSIAVAATAVSIGIAR